MSDTRNREIEIFFEGEQGHQGNVLATTFLVKFHKLINLLHRMERLHTGASSRKTEYEIVTAKKYNPTLMALKPVPKVKDYSPIEAFDWSIRQFSAVANDAPTDQRLDVHALREISEIAAPPKDGSYKRFWVKSGGVSIEFDEGYSSKARQAANRAQIAETPVRWHKGVSEGEITGNLRAVLDEDGEQEFVVHPVIGPERIVCRFPNEKRGEMSNFLFKVVTVSGNLHYGEDSPHPFLVEMKDIHERVVAPQNLFDLRGIFKGHDAPEPDGLSFLDV